MAAAENSVTVKPETFSVASPDVAPPLSPVPATTEVMSPVVGVSQATPDPVDVRTCPSDPCPQLILKFSASIRPK